MKRFYTILCLTIASLTQLHAQAPQGFNYQATVRNSSGDLIVNTNVYFRFNVIQGSQTAVPIFTETHYVPTDDLGQVNLVIGEGTANTGTFSELDWSLGSYYLGIELDTGNGYVALGTTQLLSVPYALYAQNSGNSTTTPPNLQSVLAENNSANNQQIKDLQDPTDPKDAVNLETLELQIELLNNQIDDLQNQLTDIYQNLDADGDGFTPNDGDCDDSNSSIYPGANEFCDNIDNNCNAQVDENPVDGTTWYLDSDGDGYGFIQLSVLACSQPNGYVANNDDCNDENSNIYPGAPEIADGIDNDCDGEVDEGFDESGTVTDQEGNTYEYQSYGNQAWTLDNAEMVTYRDGTPIPQVSDQDLWTGLTTGAWAYYNNDPTKHKLYNWYAIKGVHDTNPNTPDKEFAPEGWHVSTKDEWTFLQEYLIANGYNWDQTLVGNKIAKSMASQTDWAPLNNGNGLPAYNQSLNNSSGFNAFPEGARNFDGYFGGLGYDAFFWTSTESGSTLSWRAWIGGSSEQHSIVPSNNRKEGYSVRFVRD